LVNKDNILPATQFQACCPDKRKYRTVRCPVYIGMLRANDIPFSEISVAFKGLVRRSPQGCTNSHSRHLTTAVLIGVGLTRELKFLCHPRVEDSAKFDIPGASASSDDQSFPGLYSNFYRCRINITFAVKALHRGGLARKISGCVAC